MAFILVPGTGLEPAHLTALDPKSSVSTNSTTRARVRFIPLATSREKQSTRLLSGVT